MLRASASDKMRAVVAKWMSETCPWLELGQFGRLLADVDLEPREPKFGNQCGLSQIDAIRASDIWRGRLTKDTQVFLQ